MTKTNTLAALFGATTLVALAACQGEVKGDAAAASGASASAVTGATAGTGGVVAGASAAAAPATEAAAPAPASGAMLDPNSASREQLAAIPGMTPGAADAVVNSRPHADMLSVDQALAKAQVDSTQRRTIYARLWKPIDLNTAKAEEILLIPGVGKRMQHEFEEYRPYTSMAQFRREIGKYVSKDEVARLEQYVSIR